MADATGGWPREQPDAGAPVRLARHPLRDPLDLRHALGRFATGVTIVTCLHDARRWGLTVNSFASLSLDPPLVSWSLRRASPALEAFTEAAGFAVNMLAEPSLALARRFASRVDDRFAEGAWGRGEDGLPVLEAGAVAVLECRRVSWQDVGDHRLYIGAVQALRRDDAAAPLVFRGGSFHALGEAL